MTAVNNSIKPERPVDNLKFTAYKKIVDSYDEAVELIKNKKPVLGEPIVVPFYQTTDKIDPETGEPVVSVELAFGIGSADINKPSITSSTNNFVGDNILVSDPASEDGKYITLRERLDNITHDTAATVIEQITTDETLMSELINAIVSYSPFIEEAIDEKLSQRLAWKSLSDLIN